MQIILNLRALIPSSRVNGPGRRSVVFFQGCRRACRGCFNPETHDTSLNMARSVDDVLAEVPSAVDGLTISGGEPFLQPQGLLDLLKAARCDRALPVIVYTGFTLAEIEASEVMALVLPYIDVLIAGPYDALLPEPTSLARGSTNQSFHFLTTRYSINDFYMPARLEVSIGADGSLTGTGFARLPSSMETL